MQPTTLVDLVDGVPEVLRIGKGDPEPISIVTRHEAAFQFITDVKR